MHESNENPYIDVFSIKTKEDLRQNHVETPGPVQSLKLTKAEFCQYLIGLPFGNNRCSKVGYDVGVIDNGSRLLIR